MKARKKNYKPVRVSTAADVNSCASKHSKAGAGCKTAKIVPCIGRNDFVPPNFNRNYFTIYYNDKINRKNI